MEQCFKCGIGNDKALLYDVITSDGIQKVCRKCSHKEDAPLMRNKDALELKEFERKQDIYERISRVSGIDNKKKLNKSNLSIEGQDTGLRDLVEKNVNVGLNKDAKPREDLIDNFHWMIKRVRRLTHLTTKQFAEKIGEVEKTIVLAEQGVVPEGYDLIKKIEMALDVRLIKGETPKEEEAQVVSDKELSFSPYSSEELTIADLKEMKTNLSEKEGDGLEVFDEEPEVIPQEVFDEVEDQTMKEIQMEDLEKPSKDEVLGQMKGKSNLLDKKDLSKEEMDDLIFGRK